jgi:hypothetical protein
VGRLVLGPAVQVDAPESRPGDRLLRCGLIALAVPGFLALPSGGAPTFRIGWGIYLLIALTAAITWRVAGARIPRATWHLAAGLYLAVKVTQIALGAQPAGLHVVADSYKAFLLLPVVAWFLRRDSFTYAGIATTTRALLVVFLVKYAATRALTPARPQVWIENNFELMTLIGFFYLAYRHLGPRRDLWTAALVAVVFMSGSRSGLAELCLCLLVIYWRPASKAFLLYAVSGIAVAWWALRLVEARTGAGGLSSTDRWRFLNVFRQETAHWSPLEWLIGTTPVTPLSWDGCYSLSFYRALFADNDTCYSVVLHAFALRGTYDNGVLGVGFLLAFIYLALKASGVDTRGRIAILGIGIINATSVSAFNSEYYVLVLVVACGLRRPAVGDAGVDGRVRRRRQRTGQGAGDTVEGHAQVGRVGVPAGGGGKAQW